MLEKLKRSGAGSALAAAFPHTLPVLAGFLFLGIAYGMLMHASGYGVGWSVAMSAIAFCGSMQFLAVSLLASGFDPLGAFLLSLMVNARQLFYGISMLQKYKGMGFSKNVLIYTLCDETFSISSSIEPPEAVSRKYFYLSISLLDYSYWILGTLLGGILGEYITFSTEGIDFALTALFVVLFLEQMKDKGNHIYGAAGITATLAALVLFGADNLVLPAMGIILAVLLLMGRKELC